MARTSFFLLSVFSSVIGYVILCLRRALHVITRWVDKWRHANSVDWLCPTCTHVVIWRAWQADAYDYNSSALGQGSCQNWQRGWPEVWWTHINPFGQNAPARRFYRPLNRFRFMNTSGDFAQSVWSKFTDLMVSKTPHLNLFDFDKTPQAYQAKFACIARRRFH